MKVKNLLIALEDILEANRLDVAKEIAAEALGVDVDEYLTRDRTKELDFDEISEDNTFDQDDWEESYA